jgi:hypothetical protein
MRRPSAILEFDAAGKNEIAIHFRLPKENHAEE